MRFGGARTGTQRSRNAAISRQQRSRRSATASRGRMSGS